MWPMPEHITLVSRWYPLRVKISPECLAVFEAIHEQAERAWERSQQEMREWLAALEEGCGGEE